MVKWIAHTAEGRLVLKSVRLDRDSKDISLRVNGLEIAKFTASGDIVVNTEAITKAKIGN